jgi:hypothetical protein|tara:strand:- start:2839 stop:3036 length:198 start_codon:yes stop_codon:yes gene_type:complete
MIKVGDKVALFENMSKKGVVVDMFRQKSNQWMVGGAMEHIFIVRVKMDSDDSLEEHRADKVMRLE